MKLALLVAVSLLATGATVARALEPVRVSADQTHFVLRDSGATFRPWGFNYLGEFGTIFEEYWSEKWTAIEEDFREMKKLGANVVRVHLQFGTYLSASDQTRPDELARLRRLLDLAEDCGLYLNLTGLGCYRLAQVPPWLDVLEEAQRWEVQARFWQAIATTCKGHPAVFCYDLMNEPVVSEAKPGGHPWLTGELGGMYFVQRIANRPGKRTPQEIAAAWCGKMTAAIRQIDPEHLITVGVIPWAQIWPGAKPDFYAPEAARHLDFISVHFYPQAGKVPEALVALKLYDVGKPMVVEETFPLNCSLAELDQFIAGAGGIVEGWIGHYFGRSVPEYRREKDLQSTIIADFLEYWQRKAPPPR